MDTKALLASLATEQTNSRSERLDQMNSLEIATLMNEVTADVTAGIAQALPQIARAIDGIVARLKQGGRLIYMGAGTSGRLGVLDASECPPTFGVSPELVQGIIAGGDRALRTAVEGAEDSVELPVQDLKAKSLCAKDAVVAISASGYAPYCVAALQYARSVGALAISLSCNTGARTSAEADIAIEAPTGSEVLSGSTRLKAGTGADGQMLQEPHGGREGHQREAAGSLHPHHHERHRIGPGGGGGAVRARGRHQARHRHARDRGRAGAGGGGAGSLRRQRAQGHRDCPTE